MRVVEVPVSLALAAIAWLAFGPSPALLPAFALAAVAPPLTRIDISEHRLPNRLVIVPVLAGVVALAVRWLVTGTPPVVPLLAAAIYSGVLLLLALFGGMGMGDVKLAAALGLAAPTWAIAVLSPLLAFAFGGVAAVVALIRHGRHGRIAFGPFLLAGYLAALVLAAVARLA